MMTVCSEKQTGPTSKVCGGRAALLSKEGSDSKHYKWIGETSMQIITEPCFPPDGTDK